RWFGLELWMWQYSAAYLVKLLTWSFPTLPILALVALFASAPERVKRWERCLASILLALIIAYAIIAFPDWPASCPRYYYYCFLVIPLLGAKGFIMLFETLKKRYIILMLIGAVLLNFGVVFPSYSAMVYTEIYAMNDVERQVKQINPGRALIFLTP